MIFLKKMDIDTKESGLWINCNAYPFIPGFLKPGVKAKCYNNLIEEVGFFFISGVTENQTSDNKHFISLLLRGVDKKISNSIIYILVYNPHQFIEINKTSFLRYQNSSNPPIETQLNDYKISSYLVSMELWNEFENATEMPGIIYDDRRKTKYPFRVANYISWYDAIEFCNWYSKNKNCRPYYSINHLRLDKSNFNNRDLQKWSVNIDPNSDGYRLPFEAELEFVFNNTGSRNLANFPIDIHTESLSNTKFIKKEILEHLYLDCISPGIYISSTLFSHIHSKKLYEWCFDWYHARSIEMCSAKNPIGPESGSNRVLRNHGERFFGRPDLRQPNIGFRMVKNIVKQP